MTLSSKRIFITGIAGFIGFHTALFLKKNGHFVIGCDNFNDYYDPRLKRERAQLLAESGIEVVDADICEKERLADLVDRHKITHLIHLAAQAGVRYSLLAPETYLQGNLVGFGRILELLKARPQIKCVFASSSSVYGLNQKVPFAESDMAVQPANLYAATKIAGEMMAHSYSHLYGISLVGLRYFTVYGPWGRPDMAYFLFTEAILRNQTITVYDEGRMARDFTYIDDIVEGTAAALDYETPFEIFNLGNNTPASVSTLISLIEDKTKKKSAIRHEPKQPGEVQITFADIAKSQKALNFQPKTSLEKGIDSFINWYLAWKR
jgi:UDP-glucuronate 4-epimerase